MDEWVATGDQNFIKKANRRLHEFIDRSRILVFASHSPELLREVCNRAVLIEGGEIRMTGTVDDVLDFYSLRQGPRML